MNNVLKYPTEEIASSVVLTMTAENILHTQRMTTGDQHFVYAVKTEKSDYVIRMTDTSQTDKFISATYWQEKLLPLGIPLAKFIKSDLACELSEFPSLLMLRLSGDDLCNIYSQLTDLNKHNLALEMVKIQAMTGPLPDGPSYGIVNSYERMTAHNSWYDFLTHRLYLFDEIIRNNKIFNDVEMEDVFKIVKNLENEFRLIRARPFLWDASERNVIVEKGQISGIVDVDEMCFGDPLFVLGLTYTALENEGYDTLYCDYWSEALEMDDNAKIRLAFYRLFYVIVFMRKHAMTSDNQQKIIFDDQRLKNMFKQSLNRLKAWY
ncbi:MAG: phosphotransferase [Gammaproteobacteria bacterium]|nr:phosphotransferase [Gammaproteobacteria bacterium]